MKSAYQGPPTEWHRGTRGDPLRDVVLGYSKRGCPIELWGNYGVTCNGEMTTNGNAYLVLRPRSRTHATWRRVVRGLGFLADDQTALPRRLRCALAPRLLS